jgi:hypothetical protein
MTALRGNYAGELDVFNLTPLCGAHPQEMVTSVLW